MIRQATVTEFTSMPGFRSLIDEYCAEARRIDAYGDAAPTVERYKFLEKLGLVRLMVSEIDGRLEGFALGIVSPEMHHGKTVLFLDCFFVRKSARKGGDALRLFDAMRQASHRDGMIGMLCGAPAGGKAERLFKAMGLRPEQTLFWAG
jgi:hypothetical protein